MEFGLRLILASGAMFAAGLTGVPDFSVASKAAAFTAAYAALAHYLQTSGRGWNRGIAGFFAAFDAAVIAILLGSTGALDTLGLLVAVPCLAGALLHGSRMVAMSGMAGGALLASHGLFRTGAPMPVPMMGQIAVVFALGVAVDALRGRKSAHPGVGDTHGEPESAEEVAPSQPQTQPEEASAYLQLREHYRQVRTMYRDLELRSRREHLVAELAEAKLGEGEPFFKRLADKTRELLGADSVALYTLAQFDELMVVRGIAGKYPETMQHVSHRVNLEKAPGQIKHAVERALEALRTEEDRAHFTNVILSDRGRMVGMACVFHSKSNELDQLRRDMEDVAPLIAGLIREESKRQARERRLRETELMYDLAVTAHGADSGATVAARVVRELGKVVEAEHFGIFLIEGSEALAVAQGGIPIRLIEKMEFPEGTGLSGWLASGAPEIVIPDATNDPRLPKAEALHRRIHSYCIFPIQYGDQPAGFLAAGSQRAGGIDLPDVASLRAIAAELSQALARLGENGILGGLMTPKEFHRTVNGLADGYLVYLEPVRWDALVEVFGRPALAHALLKCGRRFRSRLPQGGSLCRRAEGDFVAYLPVESAHAAASWANAVSALSLVGITTPDGSANIPLAMRARVAPVTAVNEAVLEASPAP